MTYSYKTLSEKDGTPFKAAATQVESTPNDVWASVVLIDPQSLTTIASESSLASIIKSEDSGHTSSDKGVMILAVRKDTASALSGTDGDYIPIITDANGRLHVIDANSSAISSLAKAEDTAHVSGDNGIQLLAVRKDVATALATTDGDYAPIEVDSLGRVHVSSHWMESLDAVNDSINVSRIGKGSVILSSTLGLSGVTVTTVSNEIDMRNHNYIACRITVSGSFDWTIELKGLMETGGTAYSMYDGSSLCSVTINNSSRIIMWPCGTPYAKISASEGADGASCTVDIIPFNR